MLPSLSRALLVSAALAVGSLAIVAGAAAQEDKVVATVDGDPITEADLQLALTDLGEQFSRLPADQRRAAALAALIEIRLFANKAEAAGIDKRPDFERRMELLKLRALHSAVVEEDVAAKITDAEMRTRYDAEMAKAPKVEEVHARHILVKTKEEAEKIIKELDAGGDFQKLANEHTSDPSGKTTGGDLGFFAAGQMVPEFEKAAFALPVGSYTKEPVQSQFGWHIIKVEEKRQQPPPPFDQVKDQFRSVVLRDKYFALVKSLRDGAKVDISDAGLKTSIDAMEKQQQQPQPQPQPQQ